jgi:peptide/nickel transport system ATP-binding protein
MTALVEARGLAKRFVKRPDLAGRLAGRLGADIREETVHAVDGVDLAIA